MSRRQIPNFHDVDLVGRTARPRGRGIEALIPTADAARSTRRTTYPTTYTEGYEDGRAAEAALRGDVQVLQWKQIDAALASLGHAQFEYSRNHPEDAATATETERYEAACTHMDDVRRALGTLALTLADGPDAEGYARLFGAILTDPKVQR